MSAFSSGSTPVTRSQASSDLPIARLSFFRFRSLRGRASSPGKDQQGNPLRGTLVELGSLVVDHPSRYEEAPRTQCGTHSVGCWALSPPALGCNLGGHRHHSNFLGWTSGHDPSQKNVRMTVGP